MERAAVSRPGRRWTCITCRIGFLLACVSMAVHAQTFSYLCSVVTSEQGLSQNTIRAMVQDRQGFLWFATDDGLNRYDGYSFTVFKPARGRNSISGNMVTTLLQDARGDLWIGTAGRGLNRFSPSSGTFTIHRHDSTRSGGISSDHVIALCEGCDGSIWVATRHGLDRLDPGSGSFSPAMLRDPTGQILPAPHIRSLLCTLDGRLWIGTEDAGVVVFDTRTLRCIGWYPVGTGPRGLRSTSVTSLCQDRSGRIWIGTAVAGLHLLDAGGQGFTHFAADPSAPGCLASDYVRSVQQCDSVTLAILTNRSLELMDLRTHAIRRIWSNRQLTDPATLLRDASGNFWIGSTGTGMVKLVPKRKNFRTVGIGDSVHAGMSFCAVRAMAEDRMGNLWVGGHVGLNRLPAARRARDGSHADAAWERVPVLDTYNILCIREDPDRPGVLWFGSEDAGVFLWNTAGGRIEHFHMRAADEPHRFMGAGCNVILATRGHELWFGSNVGVSRWDAVSRRFVDYRHDPADPSSIGPGSVKTLCEDASGRLWIGTDVGGISILDPGSGRCSHHTSDRSSLTSLSDDKVNAIIEDQQGGIWVGTAAGLNHFIPATGSFVVYTMADGLPNDYIYGILEDRHGNLWVSTNNGLSRYHPMTETFTNYDRHDGLQGDEFNTLAWYRSPSGEMFFGGVTGFTSFRPEEITINTRPPAVAITGIRKSNEPVESDRPISMLGEIVLSHTDHVFSIEFTALDFTDPSKNRYAYCMEGFDDGWRHTTAQQRIATYTNLPPGTYRFRVRATNNDGVWCTREASLTVVITPPVWATWWFRALALLAVLVAGGGVYANRRRHAAMLADAKRRFTHELIESQEAERKRIATELHDAIGQDLLIIRNLAFMAQQAGSSESRDASLNGIAETAAQTIDDVRKVSRNLRPYQIDRLGITKALRSIVNAVAPSTPIRFTAVIEDLDGLIPREHEIHLYRILQECINNIVKHSGAAGAVITLRVAEAHITLTVNDDGQGLPTDATPGRQLTAGFGMIGLAERATIIQGQLRIRSQPGRGTTIIVTIPITGGTHGA